MEASQRNARTLAAAVLLVAMAVSIASHVVAGNQPDAPSDDEAAAAVKIVADGYQKGDAVIVRPFWNDGLWQDLVVAGVGSGRYPFAALMRGERDDVVELLLHRRVWVIGTHGRAPEIADDLKSNPEPATFAEVSPHVSVALYDLVELDHRARLTSSIARLEVSRQKQPGGRVTRCPRRGKRHQCGGKPWYTVSLEERDVFHRDVNWLVAHPGPDEELLRISWPKAPAGAALVVRCGFSQPAVRNKDGSDTTVRVVVDGQIADEFVLEPHRYVLERRLVRLHQGAREHKITFEVQAMQCGGRELMVEADVVGNVPGALEAWATGP